MSPTPTSSPPSANASTAVDRGRDYAEAFCAYMNAAGCDWRATDFGRPAAVGSERLKSLDFVVRDHAGGNLLVELKGRRDPSAGGRRFENWATAGDLTGLLDWERLLGPPARAVLVFAYRLKGVAGGHDAAACDRTGRFAFYGVGPLDYLLVARRRSPRWQTWSASASDFASVRRPFADWLDGRGSALDTGDGSDIERDGRRVCVAS
ncbi:MAG: HYExAFE family protein [Planctomycetota bacterium]